jgi:hypothetical protein
MKTEYLGKKIIRYGDCEFIGDEYAVEIPDDLFDKMLRFASEKELLEIKESQLRFENYEAADKIQKTISERFL